jgi:hypothetical protein
MQALGRKDQLRVTLYVRLALLAFSLRLSNALTSTPELRHKPGFLELGK